MKKLIFLSILVLNVALLTFTSANAQAPSGFTFQSVLRDASSDLIINTTVGTQISILQTTGTGTAVYVETHSASTNANGLLTLQVGEGSVQSGNFQNINWGAGPYFIKVETDPSGGTSYTITGTQQLLSVPYANYATTALNAVNDADADPTNELQTLSYDCNDNLLLSSGGSIKIPGLTAANNPSPSTLQNALNSDSTVCELRATYPCLPESQFYGLNYGGGRIYRIVGCTVYVAATVDQSSGVAWDNGTNIFHGIGNGSGSVAQTASIVAAQGAGNYAARLCDELTLNGFSDWYMPGWTDLANMSANLGPAGAGIMMSGRYWCTWENNAQEARFLNFMGGNGFANKSVTYRVRAVRAVVE